MNEPRNNEYADKQTTLNQDHPPRIVRWIWLYYRLDLRLAVWKQARYFSFTEAPQVCEGGNIFKPPYQSGGRAYYIHH